MSKSAKNTNEVMQSCLWWHKRIWNRNYEVW